MTLTLEHIERMIPKGEWRLPLPPTCRKCDYNLTGLKEDRCPECGTTFNWTEVRKRASRIWALTLRLRYANKDASMGIILGLSGWFAVGFVRLLGWSTVSGVVDVMAILAAFFTVILGSQVLNLRRVPKWARGYVAESPPNMWLGTAAIVLGLTLLVGAAVI